MLSDRRQNVLAALIEEYVARALPVGSRTLTERYHLGVSPATVRNELSVLEEDGYIVQPHTSAGRIPTDFGYRAFVDSLLAHEDVSGGAEYAQLVDDLRTSASELDGLLLRASSTLARITDCLSIVLAPTVLHLCIKQISLISLSPRRALVVLVTEDGAVFNRQMDFDFDLDPDDLARMQRFFSEAFSGKTLADIQNRMQDCLPHALSDPAVRLVFRHIVACLEEGDSHRSHRIGLSALMAKPEFQSTQNLIPVIHALEDDTVLLQVMQGAAQDADDVSVFIGRENKAEDLSGVSVVAAHYGRGNSAGVVAVIGPTRMDYSKVIKAVRAARCALDDAD